jgi:cell division protein FtsW
MLAAVMLTIIGLVMVYSASSVTSTIEHDGVSTFYLSKQLRWAGIGLGIFLVCYFLDYHLFTKLSFVAVAIAIILLIIVLVPGIGVKVSGSMRWLNFAGFRFQPSEVAKLAMIFWIADYFSRTKDVFLDFTGKVLPGLFPCGIILLLVILEPDLGTTVLLAAIAMILFFAAGMHMTQLMGLCCIGLTGIIFKIMSTEYQLDRIFAFINPWDDALGKGYQIIQSYYAIGSGGWFGVGLGASKQKFFWLPEQHTDFIFAVIGEELGFVGIVVVLVLFLIIISRGFIIAFNADDSAGKLIAVGMTTMIALQAFLNMGMVIGILPITGVTLPFVSYGGSSFLVSSVCIGMLASVSRPRGKGE